MDWEEYRRDPLAFFEAVFDKHTPEWQRPIIERLDENRSNSRWQVMSTPFEHSWLYDMAMQGRLAIVLDDTVPEGTWRLEMFEPGPEDERWRTAMEYLGRRMVEMAGMPEGNTHTSIHGGNSSAGLTFESVERDAARFREMYEAQPIDPRAGPAPRATYVFPNPQQLWPIRWDRGYDYREAEVRARQLLEDHLTHRQFRELRSEGYFTVLSLSDRWQYRIKPGESVVAVDRDGYRMRLCVVADGQKVPPSDLALMQKTLIECNEELFLNTAKRGI